MKHKGWVLLSLIAVALVVAVVLYNWLAPVTTSPAIKDNLYSEISQKFTKPLIQKDGGAIIIGEIEKVRDDSVAHKLYSRLAYKTLQYGLDSLFIVSNSRALALAKEVSHTYGLGEVYWNYGDYYYFRRSVMDSAYSYYNEAAKSFDKIDSTYQEGKMLYNMALIEGRIKDYTRSESTTFEAIAKFQSVGSNLYLYRAYNQLGILFYELKEYDKSLKYYQQAKLYLDKLESKRTATESFKNNLGLVYLEKQDFSKASSLFSEALQSENLRSSDPLLYARILNNYAYSKMLSGDTQGVAEHLSESLAIRDSLDHEPGIVASKIYLAEYYLMKNDTFTARAHAVDSEKLASSIGNLSVQLDALKMLGKISGNKNPYYLNKHIRLRDSIYYVERQDRNKYTRIRFETDEFIKETETLGRRVVLIASTSAFVIIVLALLFILNRQRLKNRELVFEKQQQQSNQEIYELLSKQHKKLEEGRDEERKRISQDLHDGVLSKLFGTRMNIGLLSMSGGGADLERLKGYHDELQNIEKEIRSISHTLNTDVFQNQNGFIQVIESLLQKQSSLGGFDYHFENDTETNWTLKDEVFKIHIYRIIQEASHNTIKYAEAENFTLKITEKQGVLFIQIKDDGNGFDLSKAQEGIGLKNIRSRVKAMNGHIKIRSVKGSGTIMMIRIENF